jgi:hypothetical protein
LPNLAKTTPVKKSIKGENMKFVILALVILGFSSETFAQRRVRRTTGGRTVVRTSPVIVHSPSRVVVVNPSYGPYYNGVRIVGPRYNPNPYSRRYMQSTRRYYTGTSMILGYSCYYGQLLQNGLTIHNFSWSSDCTQAVSDISYYGDFCDGADLYDQTGRHEASFTWNEECRSALGWYY